MIVLICLLIAAFGKAVSDLLKHEHLYKVSIFYRKRKIFNPRFWNPKISWANKYKQGTKTQEKFPGSTTVFVLFTDGWHLAQFIMLSAFFVSIVHYEPMFNHLIDFVIYRIIFGLIFEFFYKIILR